ncbi:MAG: hypothetical protein NTX50_24805 [Candidatus Sumerlaeota bacterium]|nr:hypothetical protein [Candidatus Sumerlaeota bacterium]
MSEVPLEINGLICLPSVHGRLTFAEEVRRQYLRYRPAMVAVELPASLRALILEGVERLPALTAVCFRENESSEARLCYVPIDPCDAMIEAIRLATEAKTPLAFVDLDVADYQETPVELPCDYVADQAGYERYCETVWPFLAARKVSLDDDRRNRYMAARLRILKAEYGQVMWVGGFAHWPGIAWHYMQKGQGSGVRGQGSGDEGQGSGAEGQGAEVGRVGPVGRVRLKTENRKLETENRKPETENRKLKTENRKLETENRKLETENHKSPSPSREDATLALLSRKSLQYVLPEIPYVAYLYERARESDQLDGNRFPKLEAARTIFLEGEKQYTINYKETVNLTQWRALMQYTRNLTLFAGRYRPDIYAVTLAAKSCVDGDYGYETLQIAASYPYQPQKDATGELPTLSIFQDRAKLLDQHYLSKPRWPEPPSRIVNMKFKRRASREEREVWKALWDLLPRFGICSWPPEDERQEKFMDFVRKRALQVVSEDRKQVEQFTTSFLDGLDIRETMRNWHTSKFYVQQTPPPLGKVGPVVVIFEDEPAKRRGSWRETLYAENNNESDIAFYAEPLGKHVVGPGICYTHFSGILSVFPACHIRNPWTNPIIGDYPTCAEKLLAAAILYSETKYLTYIASTPPAPHLRELASANRRHIIYLPIAMFSRKTLKNIRKFHILNGRHVRQYAAEYIQ